MGTNLVDGIRILRHIKDDGCGSPLHRSLCLQTQIKVIIRYIQQQCKEKARECMAPLNLLRLSFHIQIQATRGSSLPKCYAVHIIWKEQMRKRRDRNPTARSKQAIYNICEDAHVVHVFISLMSSWCNSEWIHAALRMTNENRFIPVSRSNACIAPCDATLRDMELNLSWILLCTLRKKLNKVLTNVWLLKRKKQASFMWEQGKVRAQRSFEDYC